MNHFDLDENKEYTFSEISHKLSRVLTAMTISQESVMGEDRVKLTLDGEQLESLISGLIQYMNGNFLGTFKLVQTEKGLYRIQYTAEGALN